jgi:hypothetical protein
MDLKTYRELLTNIESGIDSQKVELESQLAALTAKRETLIESINEIWVLNNNSAPPTLTGFSSNGSGAKKVTSYAPRKKVNQHSQGANRNDLVRDIVKSYESGSEVTSKRVLNDFRERHPEIAHELEHRTTIISKLLREMEAKRVLRKVQDSQGFQPAIYVKI